MFATTSTKLNHKKTMARYAGDAQASELGKFDSVVRKMTKEEKETYRTKTIQDEIAEFEKERLRIKDRGNKEKREIVRFAGWVDPRKR